ncbi:cytochrome P450 [Aspergillus steynii IBT 23096]|uniref:Cytochrome P450 n=1 Tax=Aspergillus steynii IBT 23096 TaxID=1392250 RepID=A0A2I2GPC5_9EURO|nr:cytochrome P450 [Aspergillus steynii IBT 23096]PLB54730.1 cytochrome P450 [Aspergillus steynii IBT 23096]
MSMQPSAVLCIVAGVLSHIAFFNKGEHHLYGMSYVQTFFAAVASGFIFLQYQQGLAWNTALATTLQHAVFYLVGVYSSLITYRLFFHPLRHFPGPIGARISNLWLPTQLPKHDAHRKLVALHKKYGPIVRVGSSDLSIIHPSAVPIIYGPNTRCTKGSWYDMTYPTTSLESMRDPTEHRIRRRAWSPAFGDSQLRGYEVRMRPYRQRFLDRLVGMAGEPIDMAKWFSLYTFDVMGDMAFGEGFGGIERGEHVPQIELMTSALYFVGLCLPVWALCLITRIPGAMGPWFDILDWSTARLNRRIENPPSIPDISAALISYLDGREPTEEDLLLLGGDSRLIIGAGSETSSTALTGTFYELLHNPAEITKLRTELAPHVEKDGDFQTIKIQHLPHLNGVINEALRLHPVVPSHMHRKTPPEGIRVEGVWIPGDMTVMCPQYVLGRSERCFVNPNSFIPERWYRSPELVRDKTGYAPFSIGPAGCIGKPLALMNLRTTIARLVTQFDFEFAPGENPRQFEEDAMDNFILSIGKLMVVLRKRETKAQNVVA